MNTKEMQKALDVLESGELLCDITAASILRTALLNKKHQLTPLTTDRLWELERLAYVDSETPVFGVNKYTDQEETTYVPCKYFNFLLYARIIENEHNIKE
jgi:hypothetical protein